MADDPPPNRTPSAQALAASVAQRVRRVIAAAETAAREMRLASEQEAQQSHTRAAAEAQAHLDEAVRRIDAFAEGRMRRISAIGDRLIAHAEALADRTERAERLHAGMDELVDALAAAAEAIAAEAARPPISPIGGPAGQDRVFSRVQNVPDTISFARGAPSLDIVDVEGLKAAAVRAFERDPAGTTAYGTAVGYGPLREWIANKHGVDSSQVIVTNGSMQADAFLFEMLVKPGDAVVVEKPTYDRTLLNLRGRGADVRMVSLQTDGIDVAELEALLRGDGSHTPPIRPVLAHIIPNFQNPAGYTLSLAKRRRLLELAAERGFVIFEDDPYVDIRFTGEPLPTMLSMDDLESVIYASSFSKTVCPGIRVGYLVGPAERIAEIQRLATNTYISPNMVAQSLVYEFCASGAIDASIATVKQALAARVKRLTDALQRDLPEAVYQAPEGGYFMWVTLPEGTDVDRVFEEAASRGVAFVKGTDFLLEGGQNTLRLAYSGVTEDQIDEGVSRLAEAVRAARGAAVS